MSKPYPTIRFSNSPILFNIFLFNELNAIQRSPAGQIEDFKKWILYEDEHIIAFDKPGWLVCHPSKNGPFSSLVGAAKDYLMADSLHLVSRLDRETSGVVLLAKIGKQPVTGKKAWN